MISTHPNVAIRAGRRHRNAATLSDLILAVSAETDNDGEVAAVVADMINRRTVVFAGPWRGQNVRVV